MSNTTVRTRMAPSPTGEYHVGHIRTVLYNLALTRKNNGQFLIRIEDTDQERLVPGAMDRILDVIELYGLTWDEGPRKEGPFGPYIQSQRLDTYKQYAEQLVESGNAYYCFMSSEETKAMQEIARKSNTKLRSPYRDSSIIDAKKLIAEGKSYVIRLKVPNDQTITFTDTVFGTISFNSNEVDDQVLLKSDGFPTYHLGVVVDDHLMGITHVMRGNDWLPSTPKHILLYQAFGWEIPVYIHLPNLKELGGTKKLSKRFGPVSAIQFIEAGYLTAAMLNFLMFLGWNPGTDREFYTFDEFAQEFSIERITHADLVAFDRQKLLWYNGQYIKKLEPTDALNRYKSWLEQFGTVHNAEAAAAQLNDANLLDKLKLVQERAKTWVEVLNQLAFFYKRPTNIDWSIKQLNKVQADLDKIKNGLIEIHSDLNDDSATWQHADWENAIRNFADSLNHKHGDVFMVLRMAIVGEPFSPPMFESLQILGKAETLKRLQA